MLLGYTDKLIRCTEALLPICGSTEAIPTNL